MSTILQIISGSDCQVLKMTIDKGGRCTMCIIISFFFLIQWFQICCLLLNDGCISHSWAHAEIDIIQRERWSFGSPLKWQIVERIFESHREIVNYDCSTSSFCGMYACNGNAREIMQNQFVSFKIIVCLLVFVFFLFCNVLCPSQSRR